MRRRTCSDIEDAGDALNWVEVCGFVEGFCAGAEVLDVGALLLVCRVCCILFWWCDRHDRDWVWGRVMDVFEDRVICFPD